MKKSSLQRLVTECVKTLVNENFLEGQMSSMDPDRDEMMELLQSQYGREEGFESDAEEAMYWFANYHHGGQNSNLYSVLSTSPFKPGPLARGPAKESMVQDMYDLLVYRFVQGRLDDIDDVDEISVTGGVAGYKTPFAFDPTGAKIKKQQKRNEAVAEEEPLYVEYLRDLPGEEPFMMGGQKYQYVKAKYPGGKEDIGVYVFGQDMVVSYNTFRNWYNLKEAEIVDPSTGEIAPGPRDRFEMQPGGDAEKSDFLSKDILGGYLIDWAIERFQKETNKTRKAALAVVIKMIREEFGL